MSINRIISVTLSVLLLFLQQRIFISGTHVSGTFRPTNEFFKFIIKFGFQKTERHSQRDSFGYIYGNITSKDNFPVNLTFAVLEKYSFLEFYGNRTLYDKESACQRMFAKLNDIAYNRKCNKFATGDYLREIPCEKGKLCIDEDKFSNVVPGNQFTYVISDLTQPRFWYISMVACYRDDTTCTWHYFDPKKFNINSSKVPEINYDFKLVNGNPNQSAYIPLTFNFSFDQQNTLEMYLIFFVVYLVLVPLQIYAMRRQKHPVTKLFTASLMLEFISLCFILVHMIRFAMNGIGNEKYKTTGDIFDIFSRTSFMLILLLLAKGWAVTRQQISKTGWIILMAIWIPYCAFNVVLYVWNRTEVDIISDVDEYQTWPGWIVLACRSSIMLWFLWELRNTMKYEHSSKKLDFLLHFGASSLVWFIYLPIVALVALQVSPLWRYKLLLGITNSADCLAYCVMTGLLWPNRAGQYLLLAGPGFAGMDELDEFNEAPHIVHGDTLLPPTDGHESLNTGDTNELINPHSDNYDGLLLNNGDVSTDLLSGDDVILNTVDGILIGNHSTNHHHRHNHHQHHHSYNNQHNNDLLRLNGDAIHLSNNSRVVA